MPVSIMQVLNSTASVLRYQSLESGHSFKISPRPEDWAGNGWMRSSNTKEDTLPWYSVNRRDKHIRIQVGGFEFRLSERDDRFYLGYWVESENAEMYRYLGRLTSGEQYVLSFVEIENPEEKVIYMSIYYYDSKLKTSTGVALTPIIHNVPWNVAPVIVAKESRRHVGGQNFWMKELRRHGFWSFN